MEDIAADDDLLSDMLLDSLEFEPKISTHKMNQLYRSPRYKTQQIIDIVRTRIVIDGDLAGAVEDLCNVDVVRKHLAGKSQRQRQDFQAHARRYLETYMPDAGVEFALTTRYKRAAHVQAGPESSRAAIEAVQAEVARARAEASAQQALTKSANARGKLRAENGQSLGTSMADLCVVVTRPYKVGELIVTCKGGVKDLTKSEDEALREEAALSRERRREQQYAGVLGPGRDFSVIRSAMKGCSQLLLGPARFVNHDCDPNCEFHRLGSSQMVFRCLRNVGLNEEITVYYGDNYFEAENAECMCRTCEQRGKGVFSQAKLDAAVEPPTAVAPSSIEQNTTQKMRRTSQRKGRSPPPAPVVTAPTTAKIERNGKILEKTFTHYVSQREFDDDDDPSSHVGPQCTCLTCGSPFWAPEAWWLPDECRRCERHYRIFKNDWPGRMPTEPAWSAKYNERRLQREEAKRRKQLDTASPSLHPSDAETRTPVKLSPMRDTEPTEPATTAKRRQSQTPSNGETVRKKVKRKSRIISDEEEAGGAENDSEDPDVDMVEAQLQTETRRRKKVARRRARPSIRDEEDDDDMSDLTSVSADDTSEAHHRPTSRSVSSSASSSLGEDKTYGPKMLGKHAKTETLAMYWGAPTRDKRERKPRPNGLESLSDSVKRHKHRRTASDVSSASMVTAPVAREFLRSPSGPQLRMDTEMPSIQAQLEDESPPDTKVAASLPSEEPFPHSHSAHFDSLSKDVSLDPLQTMVDTESSLQPPALLSREQRDHTSREPRSEEMVVSESASAPAQAPLLPLDSMTPAPAAQLLATRGPERTSVKNLAMAWGAVPGEGGRGSRRRFQRDVSMPLATTAGSSPKQVIDSKEGSSTPPSKKSGASSPARRPSLDNGGARPAPTLAATASPLSTSIIMGISTAQTGSPLTSASHAVSQGSQSPSSPVPSTPSERTLSPVPAPQQASSTQSPARHSSPLAGPPPVTFAARPGVVPGQPIRRNLRWGSGKVSMSRPLGPSGSPLAGPSAPAPGLTPGIKTDSEGSMSRTGSLNNGSPAPLASAADVNHPVKNGGGEEQWRGRQDVPHIATTQRGGVSLPDTASSKLHAIRANGTALDDVFHTNHSKISTSSMSAPQVKDEDRNGLQD